MIRLITGYAGVGHVTSADAGRFNAGVCGREAYVMQTGDMFAYTLKSNNEDRELSDIIIDYTAAYTAYQASLQAAGMLNQTTLLNYI